MGHGSRKAEGKPECVETSLRQTSPEGTTALKSASAAGQNKTPATGGPARSCFFLRPANIAPEPGHAEIQREEQVGKPGELAENADPTFNGARRPGFSTRPAPPVGLDCALHFPPMKKYLVEFIGTFFLVFVVGMASGPLAPLAIGATLMVMIFAGGHISGGHFNPAVTLAVWLRGKCETKDVVPYWIAQLAAGTGAALLTIALKGRPMLGPALHPAGASFIVEFLFTFALAWVVLNTATAKGTAGNSFYGLAIGFTVTTGAVAVGAISGGAFNPAVGLGVVVMGAEKISQLGIYVVADLLGGLVAALTFKFVNSEG